LKNRGKNDLIQAIRQCGKEKRESGDGSIPKQIGKTGRRDSRSARKGKEVTNTSVGAGHQREGGERGGNAKNEFPYNKRDALYQGRKKGLIEDCRVFLLRERETDRILFPC